MQAVSTQAALRVPTAVIAGLPATIAGLAIFAGVTVTSLWCPFLSVI